MVLQLKNKKHPETAFELGFDVVVVVVVASLTRTNWNV